MNNPPPVKLDIVVPSQGTWCAETSLCVALLFAHTLQQARSANIVGVRLCNPRTSILPASREKALADARASGSTHLLFIDSDQTFPADLAVRLLAHRKPVVACNVPTKQIPSAPTAWDTPRGPVLSQGKSGLAPVWRVGTGIMLLELAALVKLRSPFFAITWNSSLSEYDGEDWYFCAKLERAGIPILIDHDLSQEIGHIGSFEWHHGLTEVPEGLDLSAGRSDAA